MDRSDALDEIRQRHRLCNAAIKAQSRLDRQLESFIAINCLGWSPAAGEGKAVFLRAARIVKAVAKGAEPAPGDREIAAEMGPFILTVQQARAPFDEQRKINEKRMAELAGTLPAADWVASVRGFGMLSFARIVGEAGDLGGYGNPGKLWRRMGLAPRDGRAMATWRAKGGLTAGDWTEAGYSPRRRSVMFVIGRAMVKQGEHYRALYLERKAYEAARDPEMSRMHAHRRAQRYMEKRLLRDLWRAWREAAAGVPPSVGVPPADESEAA